MRAESGLFVTRWWGIRKWWNRPDTCDVPTRRPASPSLYLLMYGANKCSRIAYVYKLLFQGICCSCCFFQTLIPARSIPTTSSSYAILVPRNVLHLLLCFMSYFPFLASYLRISDSVVCPSASYILQFCTSSQMFKDIFHINYYRRLDGKLEVNIIWKTWVYKDA
jgi:hypothetical protein